MDSKRANPPYMTPAVGGMSDRELVLAFQAGDKAAYDELYHRHHDRVARVCYRFLNNPTDAEEAAQETFLKAFQALPRFNGQFQVGAWLARIATNVCVDHLRVRSRSHLVALPAEVPITERGPEELLVGDDPRVDIAIEKIQPLHANALKMRALDGLSHVEMAGRLSMTPPQVKALLHRARTSFKKAWDKAQGWLLLPIFGSRSLDRSSQVPPASSNLAMFSAQAPALAEKAAAAVLITMVALSGLPTSPSTSSPIEQVSPSGRNSAVAKHTRERDRGAGRVASSATPAEASAADLALALPQTIESTLKGSEQVKDDNTGSGDPNEGGELVPMTAKETHKKAKEVVTDVLNDLPH